MAENSLNRKYDVLVFGGSAGSLEVLLKLLSGLESPISFAIIIVIHRKNSYDSTLQDLLTSKTSIPVQEIEDKDRMVPGNIYLAPADYHLLVEQDHTFSLDASEKINFSRPSIDVTFQSVAEVFQSAAAGFLLSGANSDGTDGLKAIQLAGGTTIAQDPVSAQVPFMPQHAIVNTSIDFVFDLTQMLDFIHLINRNKA